MPKPYDFVGDLGTMNKRMRQRQMINCCVFLIGGSLATMAIANSSNQLNSPNRVEAQADQDEQIKPIWKTVYDQRIKTNQRVSRDLRKAIHQSSLQEMGEQVLQSATELPTSSYVRKRLRAAGEALVQLKSGNARQKIKLDSIKLHLERIIDDLSFVPLIEADLPAEFAAPTTVGEIEIKSYPIYRIAKTSMEAKPWSTKRSPGFRRLFEHFKDHSIQMTAPVEMTFKSGRVSLQPVSMAFLYPSRTVGKINDKQSVSVIDRPPTKVISMGLMGPIDQQRLDRAIEILRDRSLDYAAKFRLSDEVLILAYNDPSVAASQQFFEIQIPILDEAAKVR
jgi:hypothetical protein